MLKSQPQGSNPSHEAQILALWLKSQPRGSNPSLETQIPASRLKSQPQGSNPSLEARVLASNLSFEAQIPALKLKSNLPGSDSSLEAPNLLSIGHQLLQGHCPSNHHETQHEGNGYCLPSGICESLPLSGDEDIGWSKPLRFKIFKKNSSF